MSLFDPSNQCQMSHYVDITFGFVPFVTAQ
jgi:hypothetical protein